MLITFAITVFDVIAADHQIFVICSVKTTHFQRCPKPLFWNLILWRKGLSNMEREPVHMWENFIDEYPVLVDFLSLSDTFDDHSLLRHQESEHSTAGKEPSTNRSRIMSNISHAPPEYVNVQL